MGHGNRIQQSKQFQARSTSKSVAEDIATSFQVTLNWLVWRSWWHEPYFDFLRNSCAIACCICVFPILISGVTCFRESYHVQYIQKVATRRSEKNSYQFSMLFPTWLIHNQRKIDLATNTKPPNRVNLIMRSSSNLYCTYIYYKDDHYTYSDSSYIFSPFSL